MLAGTLPQSFYADFEIIFGTQLGTTTDRHTVSRLTYNMSIDIQYVDQHTHHVTYSMSISIHTS